jgi:hypothetical protein
MWTSQFSEATKVLWDDLSEDGADGHLSILRTTPALIFMSTCQLPSCQLWIDLTVDWTWQISTTTLILTYSYLGTGGISHWQVYIVMQL